MEQTDRTKVNLGCLTDEQAKEWFTAKLSSLSEEQILELCEKLGIDPIVRVNRVAKKIELEETDENAECALSARD